MGLKIALDLLVVLMCVPGGWSFVRDRGVEAAKDLYEYYDDGVRPREHASLPRLPIVQGLPGFPSAQLARIVGGRELPRHKYPFLALITKRDGFRWRAHCGGSILDPRHVLTAAHCVYNHMPADLKVIAGEHDHEVVEGMEQEAVVEKIFLYPFYNDDTAQNDVAVLRLATPLTFNYAVKSVQLNSNDICPTVNQMCATAGWGSTAFPYLESSRVPRHIEVPVAERSVCYWKYGHFGEDQLCIGGLGKESCHGDSGGPMLCDCGGEEKVVGITSYGRTCGIYGYPTVYAKVSLFYDWIREQTRK